MPAKAAAHVVAQAVAASLATNRQQWIIGVTTWRFAPAARKGERVVAIVAGRDVIRVGAGPRASE